VRISTWFSFFGVPSSPHPTTFPYKAKSPTLKKRITFTEEEVWREVDRALEENKDNQFTDGQVLFFNMVFCANPQYFFDPYLEFIFKEYAFSKEFDVPIANNIDEVPYEKMVIFSAISEEINACQKHKMETSKNG